MPSSSSSENTPFDHRMHSHERPFAGLHNSADPGSGGEGPQFDVFDWYPKYQSCQRYFLDHAQHSGPVQALASFINILLPFQRSPNPVYGSTSAGHATGISRGQSARGTQSPASGSSVPPPVSLIPFIRRLIVTGMDYSGVLHGFFGDDWPTGIGPMHEVERRNYLFAAKSGGWASVKRDYDMLPLETVPFLRPLQGSTDVEINAAEKAWSEWLAMEDWMVGPREPDNMNPSNRSRMSQS
jgi:hypothetical protein